MPDRLLTLVSGRAGAVHGPGPAGLTGRRTQRGVLRAGLSAPAAFHPAGQRHDECGAQAPEEFGQRGGEYVHFSLRAVRSAAAARSMWRSPSLLSLRRTLSPNCRS